MHRFSLSVFGIPQAGPDASGPAQPNSWALPAQLLVPFTNQSGICLQVGTAPRDRIDSSLEEVRERHRCDVTVEILETESTGIVDCELVYPNTGEAVLHQLQHVRLDFKSNIMAFVYERR